MQYERTIVVKTNCDMTNPAYFERTVRLTAPAEINDAIISNAITTAYRESGTKSANDVLQRMSIYLAHYQVSVTALQPEQTKFEINIGRDEPDVTKININ